MKKEIREIRSTPEYLEGHKKCGLKKGDFVQMIRTCKDYEGGWGYTAPPFLGSLFADKPGNIGRVESVEEDYLKVGFSNNEGGYCGVIYPYFILRKVEDWNSIYIGGFKVDDYVRILRKKTLSKETLQLWNRKMNPYIGKLGKIIKLVRPEYNTSMFEVLFEDGAKHVFHSRWLLKCEKATKGTTIINPFDKVLVRNRNYHAWVCDIFSHIASCPSNGADPMFVCLGGRTWQQCILFQGNEQLLDTNISPTSKK